MKAIFIYSAFILTSAFSFAQTPGQADQPASKQFLIKSGGTLNLGGQTEGAPQATAVKEMPKQGKEQIGPSKKNFVFEKQATVNYLAITEDYQPALLIKEMPKQGASKMEKYDYPVGRGNDVQQRSQGAVLPDLVKGQSFVGNIFSISTPCDNDMAISDSGFVVSVMNTNIFIRNTNVNYNSPGKSLAAFTTPVNSRHQEFDPKVMYDPVSDRFVLLCLVGNVDSTSKIIVGFSQTNVPTGNWHLYTLPGDPLNYNLWSDYPMIAMTNKELFLTINLLYNDSSWQTGFVETLVWQIDKKKCYAGLPMSSTLHSNIKHNGRAIRNLCPAKGGSQLYSSKMHFISNRNLASINDTVFLVTISDTIGSPTNSVSVKVLKSNQPYYFPSDGRQTIGTEFLATNDSRNLGAFYENNKIQYVHNTNNPLNNRSTIYYGIIENPDATAPTVTGHILANDSMDFAYPNISYAGTTPADNAAIITFDHSSDKVFPGVSGIYTDGLFNFSKILRIQNGLCYVNLLQGNQERWGDYSGSQRRYNHPGEVWMSGYYGFPHSASFPKAHAAWIAQLTNTVMVDYTSVNNIGQTTPDVSVFPNPAENLFSVSFKIDKPEYLSFQLFDANGKLITELLRDWVKVKENTFSFNTQQLAKGIYLLKITGNNNTNITKKIVIN